MNMTQSQTPQVRTVELLAVQSISRWAGKDNGIMYLDGNHDMPYVQIAGGEYCYFGKYTTTSGGAIYRLLCSSYRDLGRKD